MPEKKNNIKSILIALQNINYINEYKLINLISEANITFEVKLHSNIKKLFTYADKNNFDYILLVGEEEFNKSSVTLKNLKSKQQKEILIKDLDIIDEIR